MSDRDEFYDPDDEENVSPPPSPDEPDQGDEDLEAELQAQLAAKETESEGEEPQEPDTSEVDAGLDQLLDQQLEEAQSEPIDQEPISEQTSEDPDQEVESAAHALPTDDDLQPPDSLEKYLEEQTPQDTDMPDSSQSFLGQDNEGDIPQWKSLFATDKALNSTMQDMLVDHEQAMHDGLRALESTRW